MGAGVTWWYKKGTSSMRGNEQRVSGGLSFSAAYLFFVLLFPRHPVACGNLVL